MSNQQQGQTRIITLDTDTVKAPVIHHVFILDESGSMEPYKAVTLEGVNKQIDGLKQAEKEANVNNFLTLVSFNDNHKYIFEAQRLASEATVNVDNYEPSGNTALFDTIVDVIRQTELNLELRREKDTAKVLLTIFTDGLNNLQKRSTREEASAEINRVQNLGWTVVYIGTNQNVREVADMLNIPLGNTMHYTNTAGGYTAAFDTISSQTARYCSSLRSGATVAAVFATDAKTTSVKSFFNAKNEVETVVDKNTKI